MNGWTQFWVTAAAAAIIASSTIYISKNVTIGDVFGVKFLVLR